MGKIWELHDAVLFWECFQFFSNTNNIYFKRAFEEKYYFFIHNSHRLFVLPHCLSIHWCHIGKFESLPFLQTALHWQNPVGQHQNPDEIQLYLKIEIISQSKSLTFTFTFTFFWNLSLILTFGNKYLFHYFGFRHLHHIGCIRLDRKSQ